ncbi:DUF3742 family protein [Pseudomonas sp. MWU12-2037]|uniref:DUF3742 family protein n=1 Tax=Pseudomonas sp. MWU12-2037 TaxID=2928690 RepID=UPI00200C6EED|nr:DUF3742 family protein [Pseudomonas sp. MWU12-2037]
MTCYPKISKAERVGRWLGRAYRGLIRQEQHLRLWLVAGGLPVLGAKAIAWFIRLSVLVLLLSFSILLAGLVTGLFLIGRGVARSDFSYRMRDKEWRHGDEGYGFYENGVRTDFGRLFETDDEA